MNRRYHLVFLSVFLVSGAFVWSLQKMIQTGNWFQLHQKYQDQITVESAQLQRPHASTFFATIGIFQLNGFGIDLTLHRILLHGMYGILYMYQFLVYHTSVQLEGLISIILVHKVDVRLQCCFKRSNTTTENLTLSL